MRIAIKHDGVLVDPEGNVTGRDAGATLVRRFLRIFPGSALIGPGARHCNGFDIVPLEFLSAAETVVINMDVIDSVEVWNTLGASAPEPKVLNFVWWSPSKFERQVERAALGLSCGLFPTIANSEHTANELREIMQTWTTPDIAERADIGWANLGVRLEHVQPRRQGRVPVVLYPAIYLSERKRPRLFLEVVERVAARTEIQVEARLHETDLVSPMAAAWAKRKWAWVGPQTASRESYWQALARTTAFLACATEESYGLEYVEALAAGAVGVFPNLPWAHALLPSDYPYFYDNAKQAEELLYLAVTSYDEAVAQLNACSGGDFARWIADHHDDAAFERAIKAKVNQC